MPTPSSWPCSRHDSLSPSTAGRTSRRHGDRLRRRVRARHGIVEEHHQPVAEERADRRLVAAHDRADRLVELAEDGHDLLGLGDPGEGGEAAEVAEHDGDLLGGGCRTASPRPPDRTRSATWGDRKRRRRASRSSSVDLLGDPLLQRRVPPAELGGLRLDGVLVALDAQQRPDPGQQLGPVERLGQEVVGARLDGVQALLAAAGGQHHDRQHGRRRRRPAAAGTPRSRRGPASGCRAGRGRADAGRPGRAPPCRRPR